MSQQLGIMILIDIEAALEEETLEGNVYMSDNMGPFGSQGQGTDHLVSAIHGTHWPDGSQASEQVLNWLALGIASLPKTLPRTYTATMARARELRQLDAAQRIAQGVARGGGVDDDGKLSVEVDVDTVTDLHRAATSRVKHAGGHVGEVALHNHFGEHHEHRPGEKAEPLDQSEVAHMDPIITDITGQAVEAGIIFNALYGSPNLVNEGWYWAAPIATHRPGLWSYTMHITIHKLVVDPDDNEIQHWLPVSLPLDVSMRITSTEVTNGFTCGFPGPLPMCVGPC